MHIAMVTASQYPPSDGIGVYSSSLARELARRGHEVTILTRGRLPRPRGQVHGGVRVVRVPLVPVYPLHVHMHGLFLNQYLARHAAGIDVIHAHSPLVPVLKPVRPILTTIHAHGRRTDVPVHDLRSLLIWLQRPVSDRLIYALLAASASVVVVNPDLVANVSSKVAPGTPIRLLPNAVDPDLFHPDGLRPSSDTVLSIGRLVHGKGLEDLVAAWPLVLTAHPTARLLIVGHGPLLKRLKREVAQLGLAGNVTFAGRVQAHGSQAMVELYRDAAVVVQASHSEGMSTVILEAMASGTPVVATNVGGHRSVIEDGVTGRLVEPRHPPALANAIKELLASPAAGASMARAARRHVVNGFTWTRLAADYEALYEALVAGS